MSFNLNRFYKNYSTPNVVKWRTPVYIKIIVNKLKKLFIILYEYNHEYTISFNSDN